MIYTMSITNIKNNHDIIRNSKCYLITRSDRVYNTTLKDLGIVYNNVLAPPWDLYNEAQRVKNSNEAFDNWYDEIYIPRFYNHMKSKSCVELLARLMKMSKTENIVLICFCSKERCHARLVANVIAQSTGTKYISL